jgi:threonine synthase
MRVICPTCGASEDLSPENWRCGCGGAWEPEEQETFEPGWITEGDHSLWRYSSLLGLAWNEPVVRLGAGVTPLLPAQAADRDVLVKLEYLAPTGSFKDRGTAVMMNELIRQGVSRVVEDSSGNAGASVAAYAARAGIEAQVFVPAYASPDKRAQIGVYGARIEAVPGSREEAKQEAIRTARSEGVAYASHAYHPCFLLGQETVAWELWEQLDGRAPDWYVVPVGQGVHLLGMWLGFRRLRRAGLVDRIPRLVGVQAELLAPVCEAYDKGLEEVPGLKLTSPSLAEGLAIPKPIRGQRVLEAIRSSGGGCVSVSEEQISAARRDAALQGFYVEPTSATALAAVEKVMEMAAPQDVIVVPLTGSGLKGSPTVD